MTRRQLVTGRHFWTGRQILSVVLLVLLGGVRSVFASGLSSEQQVQSPAPSRPTPYNKLFQLQPLEQVARAQREAAARLTAPRVVCGMTLIPVDPAIDPKMVIQPKAGDTRYTIRAIEPPICR